MSKTTPSNSGAVLIHGSNRGIGLALVAELSRKEYDQRPVIATCRKPAEALELRNLKRVSPHRIEIVEMDAEKESSIENAAATIANTCETISTMISCIGILHGRKIRPERRLQDISPDQLITNFRVNAIGPLMCVKHFAPFFHKQNRTVIAALSARVGSIKDNKIGGWYAYRASKAALNMYLKNLSIELPRIYRRMICVALHPGTVDTQLSKPFQQRIPARQIFDPTQAASNIVRILSDLDDDDNGRFIAWDNSEVPW